MAGMFAGFANGQLNAESGGSQFDQNGKPLVGKYRDGTEPAGAKKAYGAGQIQIGTARTVAAAHGIPFDESKLLNDREYNLQLANLHMSDLRQHYGGDEALAVAAYHQGQGTVDKAVQKYGRDGFMKGLGPEGQNYTRKIMGTKVSAPTPIQTGQAPRLPQATPATQSELQAMQTPYGFDVQNPFTTGAQIGQAQNDAMTAAQDYSSILGPALAAVRQAQDERLKLVQGVVSAKESVNQQMQSDTDNVIREATPLWAARDDLVARQNELRTMNPLKRLFKGITDPRYNEVAMKEQQASVDASLGELTDKYKFFGALRQDKTQELNASFADQNAVIQARQDSANLDLDIASKHLAAANSVLGQLLTGNQAQLSVENAKNVARKNILANLDEGQALAALENAQKSGGMTQINGVTFHTQELTELTRGMEQQRLGIEGMRMGALTGQMNFADSMQDWAIKGMTPDQKVAALAAGGVYKGQQFDRAKLAESVEKDKAIAAQAAGQILSGDMTQQFGTELTYMQSALNNSQAQVKSLLGSVPDNLTRFYGTAVTRLAKLNDLVKQADAQGAGSQMRQQLMGEMAQLRAGLNEQLQAAANAWAGTDKNMGKVVGAWLTGGPVSPQESSQAMVFMARNGVSAGIMGPGSDSIMKGVKDIVSTWDRQHSMPGQKKDEAGLVGAVNSYVQSMSQSTQLQSAISSVPQIARQIRSPLAKISQRDFEATIQAGDHDGKARVAAKYGFADVGQLDQFLQGKTGGQTQALLSQARSRSGNPNLNPKDIGQEIFQTQVATGIQYLNANFGNADFSPGDAYADLLTHPEAMKTLLNIGDKTSAGGFADYAVKTASGSGYSSVLSGYMRAVTDASQAVRQQTIRANAQKAQSLIGDPIKRTQFVLGLIPNLTQNEENVLLKYIQKTVKVPVDIDSHDMFSTGQGTAAVYQTNDTIDSIIMGGKIADPTVEQIRRKAAQHWMDYSQAAQRGFDRMTQGK